MLPDALTAAGVVPATEFSQNLCEAIVAVLRESIVAAIPKMLEVIPTPPSPAADPDPSVAEGVDPDPAAADPAAEEADPDPAAVPAVQAAADPLPIAVPTVSQFTNVGIRALIAVGLGNPDENDPPLQRKVYVCLYLHYLVGVFLFLSFFLYMFFVLFLRRPLKYFQFLLL